jgi:hypothetical protein
MVDIPTTFEQQPDFCILLINPRHDPRSLKPYVIKLMLMLFQSQSSPPSVCVLINFRDQQNSSPPPRLSEEDVKRWIGEAKLQYAETASLPLIQTGVASMKNCYGLNTLHHFIYQSYLNRKRLVLEEQLQDIVQASKESMTMSTHMSYDEFLRILERPRTQKQQQQPPPPPPADRHVPNGVAPVSSPQQQPSTKRCPPTRRTFHAPSTPPILLPPKGVDTKKTLDDFFADDDSDDGIVTGTKLNSSDDEEDDFYYDANGNRAGANNDTDEEIVTPPTKHSLSLSNLSKSKSVALDQMRKDGSIVDIDDNQSQNEAVLTHMVSNTSNRQRKSKAASLTDGDKLEETSMHIQKHTQNGVGTEQGRAHVDNVENEIEPSMASKQCHDDDDSNATEQNGWEDDNDGLDLDDHDDLEGKNAKQHRAIETAPESNEESTTENGWDEENDALDDISDHKVQSGTISPGEDDDAAFGDDEEPDKDELGIISEPVVRYSEDDAKIAGGEQLQDSTTLLPESPEGDSQSIEETEVKVVKESKGQNNDYPVETISVDAVHDEDDDDFLIGAKEQGKLSQENVYNNAAEDDDDDSEFMIVETSNVEAAPRMGNKDEAITKDHRAKRNISEGKDAFTAPPDADTAVPTARNTLSVAALAAIQAAEKEAQFILAQDTARREDEAHLKRLKRRKRRRTETTRSGERNRLQW